MVARAKKTKYPGIFRLIPSRRFPNGGWKVRYRDAENRSTQRTFETKEQALDFQASVRTDKQVGSFIAAKDAATLLRVVADGWLSHVDATTKPKTAFGYRRIVEFYIKPELGSRPIGKVTPADIKTFLAETDTAPSTQRNIRNVLNGIFIHAIDANMVKVNPVSRVKRPKVQRREMLFISPEQVRELADTIAPELRTWVLTAAYSGLRAGELVALKVGNVDTMKSRIRVKESTADVAGRLIPGPPKSEKSLRTVPIPRFLADLLAEQMAWKSQSEYVFTGANGGQFRHNQEYQKHFRPAVKKLVADGDWPSELSGLRFHDLRHTYASILAANGIPLTTASKLLGHSSVAITADIYTHMFEEQHDEVATMLDGVFATKPKAPKRVKVVALNP